MGLHCLLQGQLYFIWEGDNIKMALRQLTWDGVHWLHPPEDSGFVLFLGGLLLCER
jgi:hypothetical protein